MFKVLLILLIPCISFFEVFGQDIVINEVMYSNSEVIVDGNGEYSDWIELYNSSDFEVNLEGYHLSDDIDDIEKWTFPSVTISSGGFLIVFANGLGDGNIEWLHTNFKLEVSGEELVLSNNFGAVIDQLDNSSRPNYISLGRCPDGGESFGELLNPTPDFSNNANNVISTSEEAGYYLAPINLDIVGHSAEEDVIRFTTDGSIPDQNAEIFNESLLLESRVGDPNVLSQIITTQSASSFVPTIETFKINTIRYASFRNGIRNSIIYSKSFLIDENMVDRYPYPIISLITEEDNLFDYNTGIYVPGVNYTSSNSIWTGNYFMRGEEWERDAHIEFFEQNGDFSFSQDIGIRIFGGKKRGSRVKSLQFFARKEYGKKKMYYDSFLIQMKKKNTNGLCYEIIMHV